MNNKWRMSAEDTKKYLMEKDPNPLLIENFAFCLETLSEHSVYLKKEHWHYLSLYGDLDEGFILKHSDELNWELMQLDIVLSNEALHALKEKWSFSKLHSEQMVPNELIEWKMLRFYNGTNLNPHYGNKWDAAFWEWKTVALEQKLERYFLHKYVDFLEECDIDLNPNISDEDTEEFGVLKKILK